MAKDLIPDVQAAALAGVSINTLQRFAEVGYLLIENDQSGAQLFSKKELEEVFGISESLSRSVEVLRSPEASPLATSNGIKPSAELGASVVPIQKPSEVEPSSHREAKSLQAMRYKTVIDMQERLIGALEEQLKGVSEERDWLRVRLERQEDKSERDQLLILSETQMIRKLVSMNERPRSSMRLALEWLGLVAPAHDTKEAIEIRKSG